MMTFTEAATVVLRLVGKPLHYKDITDVAIARNLLSHVGKSPEVTMGARLAAQVKKVDKENVLARVKPGVFALSEWDEKFVERGLSEKTPALELAEKAAKELGAEALAALESSVQGTVRDEDEGAVLGLLSERAASHRDLDSLAPPPDEDERHRAELSLGATELFAPEDDDEQPIFGAPAPETSDDEEGDGAARDGKRRRRRRRGKRREDEGGEGGDDLPAYTVSDAPDEEVLRSIESESDEEDGAPRLARGEPRHERDGESRAESARGEGRGEARGERSDARGEARVSGLIGADALYKALGAYDRAKGPVPAQTLADALRRQGKSELVPGAAAVIALAAADNLAAERQGRAPRFRISGSKLALLSWSLDKRGAERLDGLGRAVTEVTDATVRALADQLAQVGQRGLAELFLVLLDRLGVKKVTTVKRPGAHGSELHLSGVLPAASSPLSVEAVTGLGHTVGICLRRDGRDIGRERVTEIRGALHHYGPASSGWLVTTGQVLSGAREEAQSSSSSPVALTGRAELAELFVRFGVGVRAQRIEVPVLDADLFEALSGR